MQTIGLTFMQASRAFTCRCCAGRRRQVLAQHQACRLLTSHALSMSWNRVGIPRSQLCAHKSTRGCKTIEREWSGGRVPAILDMVKSDSVKAQLEHKRFEAQTSQVAARPGDALLEAAT